MSLGVISDRVIAIGRIEEVDVVPRRVVARLDHLTHLIQAGRGDRAAGAGHLEKVRLVELPGFRGVCDEYGLEGAILASQALHHPEEKCLCELAIPIGHAARNIEHEEDDRVHRRLTPSRELTEAQVIVGEAPRPGLLAAALHHLLEGSAPVQARARAAPIPPFTDPVRILGRTHARLQIGQLHLFPEPVDDVVDLDLQHELNLTLVLTTGPLLARALIGARIGQHVPGLGSALTDTLGLAGSPQPKVVVLEHAHRDAYGARAVVDDFAARDDLRQMLAHRFAHLLIVSQPVTRATREQLIPLRKPQRAGVSAALAHGVRMLTPCVACRYSCASSVVT